MGYGQDGRFDESLIMFLIFTMVGGVLPDINPTVTLSSEKDEYGIPKPVFTFSCRKRI